MRLRKPCQHDRYEPHTWVAGMWDRTFVDCQGGEFLPEDAIVIEKVDGDWPPSLKGWGGLLGVLLELQQYENALAADQVGEPG